ncbi:MFS transporter [Ideonella sp. YS5]|uniref:MFS transporter n=1 Tax=Ideonella sp. YS5 TaxID=3453714 RepID=UPI003EE8CC84
MTEGRGVHPVRYGLLILPFGVTAGFLTVTMAWLLHAEGVAATDIAALIALSYLPHTWKFFWAPMVDLSWRRKGWYLLGCTGCATGTFATGALAATPGNLSWMSVAVLATNVAATLLGMSIECLMAQATPEAQKGRAAGWFQAGNLGGLGVGGGAGLWMVQVSGLSAPAAAAVLGGLCGLCGLALIGLREPPPSAALNEARGGRLREAAADLWAVARSRRGALAILVCFLPVGTGAATNLWSVVAGDWQASAATVALVSGTLGGVISAAGCLAGGFVCDRLDRQRAYCLFGLVMVAVALAMAFAPRSETSFVVFASAYAFVQGLTYAGFSAVVLEAIGRGAAATKYNLLASLSNMPIAWVTLVDGWTYEHRGPAAFLCADAATGLGGLLVFAGAVAWSRRRLQAA